MDAQLFQSRRPHRPHAWATRKVCPLGCWWWDTQAVDGDCASCIKMQLDCCRAKHRMFPDSRHRFRNSSRLSSAVEWWGQVRRHAWCRGSLWVPSHKTDTSASNAIKSAFKYMVRISSGVTSSGRDTWHIQGWLSGWRGFPESYTFLPLHHPYLSVSPQSNTYPPLALTKKRINTWETKLTDQQEAEINHNFSIFNIFCCCCSVSTSPSWCSWQPSAAAVCPPLFLYTCDVTVTSQHVPLS